MSTKNIFSKAILLVLLLIYGNILLAQDTEFWFVAPHNSEQVVASYGLNRPVFLAISNPNASAATVKITLNNGGTSIVINQVVAANGFYKKDFVSVAEVAQIQNPRSLAGSVTNYGIHIESNIPVTAYFMSNHTDSRDIYTLKGSSALGKNFYVPMQSDNACTTGSYVGACDQIDIVATEDNTSVTIVPKSKIRIGVSGSSEANVSYTKILNKGQTLKIMEYTINSGSLAGSSIVSDKDIAVTVTEDLVCGDTSGDQIVPITSLGTRYVVAKGYMTTATDRVYLIGTKANTTVTINNGSVTKVTKTLQAGECYPYYFSTNASSNAIYIEASEPIYVYQRTGYNEEGAALLPSMYSISQNKMSYYQVSAHHEKGVLIFRTGTGGGFKISYGSTTAPLSVTPIAVPGVTEWQCARFDLPAAANNQVVTISNSQGIFSFGYIAANYPSNNSTSYGYMTAFGDFKFPEISYKCVGEPLTLHAGYAKAYRWWKGRATETGKPTIGTGSSYTVPASEEGYYSVEIDMDPRKIVVETYVKNDLLNLTTTIPEYVKVNNSTSFSATVTRPEGKTFEWTFADATPPSGLGATVNDIKWTAAGSKAVKLSVKNTELGCADEVVNKTIYVYDIQNDEAIIPNRDSNVPIDVLANDDFPSFTPEVSIATGPQHGTASVSGNKIVYTPTSTYAGNDKIQYKVTYNTHTDYAWVYIQVVELPDNIITDEGECTVPFEEIEFGIKLKWTSKDGTNTTNLAHDMSSGLVGDLDGDGIPEIITYNGNYTYMYILNGATGESKATIAMPSTGGPTGGWAPIINAALVDSDGNGMAEIIHARGDRTIRSYEVNTTSGTFTLKDKWNGVYPTFQNPTTADIFPHINVVDFNGDGRAELLVYNKIYDAVTGKELGETEPIASAYVGRNAGAASNKATNFQTTIDIDGDGLPEIVAGGKVYKVTISDDLITATCTKLYENANVIDGHTAVADVDLDGNLEVVVINRISTSIYLNIWRPREGNTTVNRLIQKEALLASGACSFPFIGDIDGEKDALNGNKKYPEICVNFVSQVRAYKYDPSQKKFVLKWTLGTSDTSGGTTLTLFDFDNNGVNELVYRDESTIRIINGSGSTVHPTNDILASFSCGSGTAYEYPTIADIDGDGSANICVTCSTSGRIGVLRAYESNDKPWAPTRKVWNQVSYEPTLINEDLTITRNPFPKHTMFEVDGEKYYPYNGSLIQVPIMDLDMKPIVRAADPYIISINAEQLNTTTARISVIIGNQGQVNANSSLPVSLYFDSAIPANLVATKPLGVTLLPGNTATLTFDIPLADLRSTMIARIQDDGTTYPVVGSYTDCDMGNNVMQVQTLIAIADKASPEKNKPITIDVLANDKLSSCNESTITLSVESNPVNGTAALNGKKIKYTPKPNFIGTDSFTYKIKCGAQESIATVSIVVNSLLMVEKLDNKDAEEPNTPGKFRIKYTDPSFSLPTNLEVHYTITPVDAVAGTDYDDTPLTGIATIIAGQSSVDITITPKNNFKVEGNNRKVQIIINSATVLP